MANEANSTQMLSTWVAVKSKPWDSFNYWIWGRMTGLCPANIRLDENILKMSWGRFSSCSSEEVFKTSSRHLAQDQHILGKRSCQVVFQKRLQDICNTSSRCFQEVFKMSLRHSQDVLLRRLQDVLQRYLQDVFKTYHQVKLFLLTRFQDVFEMYSKYLWDVLQVLQRRLSTEGFA